MDTGRPLLPSQSRAAGAAPSLGSPDLVASPRSDHGAPRRWTGGADRSGSSVAPIVVCQIRNFPVTQDDYLRRDLANPRLRLLVAAVLALGALLLPAAPASAHATLELDRAGRRHGGDDVARAGRAALQRGGPDPARVDPGVRLPVGEAGRRRVPPVTTTGEHAPSAVNLPKLDKGSFIVTWRVTSADAHPIHGAFTFTVGEATGGGGRRRPGPEAAGVGQRRARRSGPSMPSSASPPSPPWCCWSAPRLRGAALAGRGRARPHPADALGGVGGWRWSRTVVGIPVQGVYVGRRCRCRRCSRRRCCPEMLDDRFGQVWTARLLVLGLLAFLSGDHGPPERRTVPVLLAAGALCAGLLLHRRTGRARRHPGPRARWPSCPTSPPAGGEPVARRPGAAGAWRSCPAGRPTSCRCVVPRFSRLAFVAVITILVTGTFQSWRQVRSTAALTETTYGRLLIVKVVLFAVLVGLGALSRRVVQARYRVPAARLSFGPGRPPPPTPTAPPWPTCGRAVGAETVIAVVVLAVTAAAGQRPAGPLGAGPALQRRDAQRPRARRRDRRPGQGRPGRPAPLHAVAHRTASRRCRTSTPPLTLPSHDVGPLDRPAHTGRPRPLLGLQLRPAPPGPVEARSQGPAVRHRRSHRQHDDPGQVSTASGVSPTERSKDGRSRTFPSYRSRRLVLRWQASPGPRGSE